VKLTSFPKHIVLITLQPIDLKRSHNASLPARGITYITMLHTMQNLNHKFD
jgi:hypothetical protein